MKKILILVFLSLFFISCNEKIENTTTNLETNSKEEVVKYNEGDIVAVMETTKGNISILMETQKAPITTTNFIGLVQQGYYDGIIFHRIIKSFMIQGGDPEGTGIGGTSIFGEKFDDEFHSDLKNVPYTISMANSGPNTNGSQFFINTVTNSHLDNRHSVFGKVIKGFDVVDSLENVETGANNRPVEEVKMIKVEIKEFKGGVLNDYEINIKEKLKEIEAEKKAKLEAKKNDIVEESDIISLHYTLTLEDGNILQSSVNGNPLEFKVGTPEMIKGFNTGVLGMKIGDKKTLTITPDQAYGEYDESKTEVIAKTNLQGFVEAGIELKVGVSLPTERGEYQIIDVTDESVTLDLNHSLAGKTLIFDIELLDIK